MTYSSGWYTQSLLYLLVGTTMTPSGDLALTGNDANNYLSLLNSSPTNYSAPVNYGGATTAIAWANTDEVTGTGWSTGGVQLSTAASGSSVTTTFAQGGSGPYYLEYSWTNALSVASTTLTGIYGFTIYSHAISSPVTKPDILTIYVGTGYSTVSGTLGITPSGSGLSQITLTA